MVRYKKDIRENVQGLAFINGLRPISYTVNVKAVNEYNNKRRRSAGPDIGSADVRTKRQRQKWSIGRSRWGEIIYNGFVAQEVELAAKKLNFRIQRG